MNRLDQHINLGEAFTKLTTGVYKKSPSKLFEARYTDVHGYFVVYRTTNYTRVGIINAVEALISFPLPKDGNTVTFTPEELKDLMYLLSTLAVHYYVVK